MRGVILTAAPAVSGAGNSRANPSAVAVTGAECNVIGHRAPADGAAASSARSSRTGGSKGDGDTCAASSGPSPDPRLRHRPVPGPHGSRYLHGPPCLGRRARVPGAKPKPFRPGRRARPRRTSEKGRGSRIPGPLPGSAARPGSPRPPEPERREPVVRFERSRGLHPRDLLHAQLAPRSPVAGGLLGRQGAGAGRRRPGRGVGCEVGGLAAARAVLLAWNLVEAASRGSGILSRVFVVSASKTE